jgi:purine-nucleoside phosphorylase
MPMGVQIPQKRAVDFLEKSLSGPCPNTAIVLGSGLGGFVDSLHSQTIIETSDIPDWPVSTVGGHQGRLILGKLEEMCILVQQGRVHFYEGYNMQEVVFPVRVLGQMGVKNFVVTNAAGGINPLLKPGDFMLISDHLNLMFSNPLIGVDNKDLGPRFPDMSHPYDGDYLSLAQEVGRSLGLSMHQGILAATTGPIYETAAEIQMIGRLGGDAVCMSTVPEVIAAVQMGMRVLGISCITNMGTGLSEKKLSHEDVKRNALKMNDNLTRLLSGIVNGIFFNKKQKSTFGMA